MIHTLSRVNTASFIAAWMTLISMPAKHCSGFQVTGIVDGVLFYLSKDIMKNKIKMLKENFTHEKLANLKSPIDN